MKNVVKITGLMFCMMALIAGNASANGSQEKTESGVIELNMLYAMDVSDSSQVERWNALMDEFDNQHPDIRIKTEFLYSEAYHNKLSSMAVSGQLPDLMLLWPGKRTGYIIDNGLAADLSERMEPHRDIFAPIAVMPQGSKGGYYEVPETINVTHVMFTNEKLLKELGLKKPETMDELIAQGPVIRDAGLIPISMSNGDGWQMQSCLLSALVERTGGLDWYGRAVKGDNASFRDPEFINALQIIQTLYEEEMFTPGLNQAPYGQETTDFINEQAVYMIDGGWRVNNLVNELTEEQKEYVSLGTFPDVPSQKGESGSTAAVAGTGFGMNANLEGPKADAAWEWIWFFGGPEGSAIRKEHGAVPACKVESSAPTDLMVAKLTDFMKETPGAYVLDSVLSPEGMGLLQPGMQEMMLGIKTPEQLAAEFEEWTAANDSSRKK